jgi:hypothetical protein
MLLHQFHLPMPHPGPGGAFQQSAHRRHVDLNGAYQQRDLHRHVSLNARANFQGVESRFYSRLGRDDWQYWWSEAIET